MIRHLGILLVVLVLVGCSAKQDRHDQFYSAIGTVAKAEADERAAELRIKVEFLKTLFATQATAVRVSNPTPTGQLIKVMAMMMLFNDRTDPRRLQYALQTIPKPLPTVGERVTDGVFRTLPVALGIAGAAYGGYLINKATQYGAQEVVAGAPTTVNNSTTNEHYNVNSYNSQEAHAANSNAGAGSAGGGRNSNSGNQGIAVGQSMDFEANNPAMRSGSYQAPYTPLPPAAGPVIPVSIP
jgi:hypothetical protein